MKCFLCETDIINSYLYDGDYYCDQCASKTRYLLWKIALKIKDKLKPPFTVDDVYTLVLDDKITIDDINVKLNNKYIMFWWSKNKSALLVCLKI